MLWSLFLKNAHNIEYEWIDDMFVSRTYRKLGIDKNLMLAAINKLINLKVDNLIVHFLNHVV